MTARNSQWEKDGSVARERGHEGIEIPTFASGAAYGRKDGIRRCIQRLLEEGYYPTSDAIKRLKELEVDK